MVRRFNGHREVLRRLQERNEARAQMIDGVREIGGLPPVEVAPFTPPLTRPFGLGPVQRRNCDTNFVMQYMGHPMTINTAPDLDRDDIVRLLTRVGDQANVVVHRDTLNELDNHRVGVNLQGLRDVETVRVRERFGIGAITNAEVVFGRQTRRNHDTIIRGALENRAATAYHTYFQEPNWGELFGYTSNENSKQLLKKDWNVQGEFLEEEKPPPVKSLWGDMPF